MSTSHTTSNTRNESAPRVVEKYGSSSIAPRMPTASAPVKITAIDAVRLTIPQQEQALTPRTPGQRRSWTETDEVAGTIALKNISYPHHIYMSHDRSRIVALEVEMRHLRADFRETKEKVSEMHSLLLQAKGAKYIIVASAAIGGFVSAKLAAFVPWLPK